MIKLKDLLNEACWKGYRQFGMKKKGKRQVPNCVPVDEEVINEIGEGVTPFSWKRTGVTKVDSWMSEMAMVPKSANVSGKWEQLATLMYEFKSDKATYEVRIAGGYAKRLNVSFGKKPAVKPADFNLIIVVAFDLKDKKDTSDEPEITNFGEQFKVLSTVVAITEQVVKEISEIKWVSLAEIRIVPKLEVEDEGKSITQSKRGRFYLEYIKKQGRKLPGQWTVEVTNEMFVLRTGKLSSTNPDKFIEI